MIGKIVREYILAYIVRVNAYVLPYTTLKNIHLEEDKCVWFSQRHHLPLSKHGPHGDGEVHHA